MEWEILPLAPALGAEIEGPGLSRAIADSLAGASEDGGELGRRLRQALLRHEMLVLRDLDLDRSPEELLAISRWFGTPQPYPFLDGIEGHPEVVEVKKLEHEKVNFGGLWHADTTYLERPPKATLLLACEVPSVGGDTLFSSASRAYEALSPTYQSLLAPLRALNVSNLKSAASTRVERIAEQSDLGDSSAGTSRDSSAARVHRAVHPIVRSHPKKDAAALFVNGAHTESIEGMNPRESRALLDFLLAHVRREDFTCRLRWRPGSLAIWDNRCTQHYPLNDYAGERRRMLRVSLQGGAVKALGEETRTELDGGSGIV